MSITSSLFSLQDVVNTYDESIRPSSLEQARLRLELPTLRNTLTSFSGSDNPTILNATVVSSTVQGAAVIGTVVSPDDVKAIVQYRKPEEPEIIYTSSLVDFTTSEPNVLIELPNITGSFSDFEYRLITFNGFNFTPSITSSWQETGSSFVLQPDTPFYTTVLTDVTSSYSSPDLYPEFIETNTINLELLQGTKVFLSTYHACPDKFKGEKPVVSNLVTDVYIEKTKTFANATYFIISSSVAGRLSSLESEIKVGIEYYLSAPNGSTLRYVQCKFQPKPETNSGENYIILIPTSNVFTCNDPKIRLTAVNTNITRKTILNRLPGSKLTAIYDELNSRIDTFYRLSNTPEFKLENFEERGTYFLSVPEQNVNIDPTIPLSGPINSIVDSSLFFIRSTLLISGSYNTSANFCTQSDRVLSLDLPSSDYLPVLGIRNDPTYRPKVIPLHKDYFGPGKWFIYKETVPDENVNGFKIYNYSTVLSTYNSQPYSYLKLNYNATPILAYTHIPDGGKNPDGSWSTQPSLVPFCTQTKFTGSIFQSTNPFTQIINCGDCSKVEEINLSSYNKHKVFLGMFPLTSNLQRTEGLLIDGGGPASRCVSSSGLTADSTGLFTVTYFGSFCSAQAFNYEKSDFLPITKSATDSTIIGYKEPKNNSVYVLQTTGSFLNNNKDEAKLRFVKFTNGKIIGIGECGSCLNLPSHPYPPELFQIFYKERYSPEVLVDLQDTPYTSQIQLIHSDTTCCRQVEEQEFPERSIEENQSLINPRYVP